MPKVGQKFKNRMGYHYLVQKVYTRGYYWNHYIIFQVWDESHDTTTYECPRRLFDKFITMGLLFPVESFD